MSGTQVAMLILRLMSSEDGRKTLRTVLISLVAVFLAFFFLVAAILNILLAPFQYDGVLGEFQE